MRGITSFPKILMILLVEIQIVIIVTPRHFPDDSIPSPIIPFQQDFYSLLCPVILAIITMLVINGIIDFDVWKKVAVEKRDLRTASKDSFHASHASVRKLNCQHGSYFKGKQNVRSNYNKTFPYEPCIATSGLFIWKCL